MTSSSRLIYVGSPYNDIENNGLSRAEQFSKASNFIVLGETDVYSIAVPSYIAGGGDGYSMLDNTSLTRTGYGISCYEATAAFLGTIAPTDDPGLSLDDQQAERIVQISGEQSIGQPDCSCLQNQRHKPTIPGKNTLDLILGGIKYDVPVSYGMGSCQAWDLAMPYCTLPDNKPSYCVESWCYVDPVQCHVSLAC